MWAERELRPRYEKARKEGRGRKEGRDRRSVGGLLIPIAGLSGSGSRMEYKLLFPNSPWVYSWADVK